MNYAWDILMRDGNPEFFFILVEATAKATFLLGFAALINLLFRRLSAATRHLLCDFRTVRYAFAAVLVFDRSGDDDERDEN
jgi:hypothetical protein